MSGRNKILLSAVILTPIVIVVVILAVLLSSIPTPEERVEQEAKLPILLLPEDDGAGPARGEITLMAHGEAVLDDFPIGVIDQTNDFCTSWDGSSTFSGEATWTVNGNSIVRIKTKDGEVSIGPYAPRFGELAWYRFGLLLCDGTTLWYWDATN